MTARLWRFVALAALVVVIGASLWWALRSRGDGMAPSTPDVATGTAVPRPGEEPIAAYVRFATAESAVPDGRADAAYLAEGLRRLAGVLGTLGIGGSDLNVNLRVAAEHILLNPASAPNASIVRELLVTVAGVLGVAYPAQRDTLRRLAAGVVAGRALTEQVPAMRRFFRACGDAVQGDHLD